MDDSAGTQRSPGGVSARSVAEVIITDLVSAGVDHVFGVPGTHALPLFEAIRRTPQVRMIAARSEAGSVFMADGFARTSGRIGVSICSTGPGALNSLGALGTADADGSPVLNIISDIPQRYHNKEAGFVHEVPNQLAAFRDVCGWSGRLEQPDSWPDLFAGAMAALTGCRKRTAVLEIPADVLDLTAHSRSGPAATRSRPSPVISGAARAARMLGSAVRPTILVGEQVAQPGVATLVVEIAERLQATMILTPPAKGHIADSHPLSAGASLTFFEVREHLALADGVLVIGDALTPLDTEYGSAVIPAPIIQLADQPRPVVDYKIDLLLEGLGDMLAALAQELRALKPRCSRYYEVAGLRADLRDRIRRIDARGIDFIEALRAAVPPEAIICHDVSIAGYWGWHFLLMSQPGTYIYPWRHATMGFGLPAALGAKLGRLGTPLVLLCGDGGFVSALAELASFADHRIAVIVIVVNNGGYGIIRQRQEARYGAAAMSVLRNPSFPQLARAFGLEGQTLASSHDLQAAVAAAMLRETTTIIEVPVDIPSPFGF